jgi:SAM-dependent methyltransferase
MHKTAYQELEKFAETLPKDKPLRIGDVGACDVNGCLRPVFEKPPWVYEGIDQEKGKNVDIVVQSESAWITIPSGKYDVLVSVSTLEHTIFPWLVVAEMGRILKPGGIICLCAPYAWPYHTFPIDCWRFYPEAMKAMMRMAGLVVDKVYMKEFGKNPDCGDTIAIGHKPA